MRWLNIFVWVALCLRQEWSAHAFRHKLDARSNLAQQNITLGIRASFFYNNHSLQSMVRNETLPAAFSGPQAPSSWNAADGFLSLLEHWVSDAPKKVDFPLDTCHAKVVKCGQFTVDLVETTREVAEKTMQLFALMDKFWLSLDGMTQFLENLSPRISGFEHYLERRHLAHGAASAAVIFSDLYAKRNEVATSLQYVERAQEQVKHISDKILGARPPPPPSPSAPLAQKATQAAQKAAGVFEKIHGIVRMIGMQSLGASLRELLDHLKEITRHLNVLKRIEHTRAQMPVWKQRLRDLASVCAVIHGSAGRDLPEASSVKQVCVGVGNLVKPSHDVIKIFSQWSRQWMDLKEEFDKQVAHVQGFFEDIGVVARDSFRKGVQFFRNGTYVFQERMDSLSFPSTCESL